MNGEGTQPYRCMYPCLEVLRHKKSGELEGSAVGWQLWKPEETGRKAGCDMTGLAVKVKAEMA